MDSSNAKLEYLVNEALENEVISNKKNKSHMQNVRNSFETQTKTTSATKTNYEKRCARKVFRNKYERNTPEICNWWWYLFDVLEKDASIPPEEQLSVLEDIFRYSLLQKILKICGTRDRKFKQELDSLSEDDLLNIQKQVRLRSKKSDEGDSFTDKRPVLDKETATNEEINLNEPEAMSKSTGIIEKLFVTKDVPKSKMYIDFFKRNPNRVAVWRTLPPISMNEMNLNQKADAITEQIARDFINWLRDLGGDEELSLSVESVIEMFEIGFHNNSATSLKVNVKEMPSVPRKVAEARNMPEKAKRRVLHQEIRKDIKASKKKTTYTAFGGHLPIEMQVRPPAENYFRKWRSCDRVPERLASMAAVWQGITHLKSTRAYCEFLIGRPEIKPPKYLLDCGMMNLKNLKEIDEIDTYSFVDVFD